MEKCSAKHYTPTKPSERSSTIEENEDVEFKLSKFEKVVEIMKEEMVRKVDIIDIVKEQELDAFKYDLHSINGEIWNELSLLHTFNSSTYKDKEKKKVDSQ